MSKLPFNSENEESLLKISNVLAHTESGYRFNRVTVTDNTGKQYSFDVNMENIREYILSKGMSSVAEADQDAKHFWNDKQVLQNYANSIGTAICRN